MNDLTPIQALMERYFDGLYASDAEALGEVLHPRAIYACPTGGELVYQNVPAYLDILRRREAPASRAETRADVIEQIQLAGPDLAFVRARCRVAERHFTDLLTLTREGGQWRILAKVFHHERWLEPEPA